MGEVLTEKGNGKFKILEHSNRRYINGEWLPRNKEYKGASPFMLKQISKEILE